MADKKSSKKNTEKNAKKAKSGLGMRIACIAAAFVLTGAGFFAGSRAALRKGVLAAEPPQSVQAEEHAEEMQSPYAYTVMTEEYGPEETGLSCSISKKLYEFEKADLFMFRAKASEKLQNSGLSGEYITMYSGEASGRLWTKDPATGRWQAAELKPGAYAADQLCIESEAGWIFAEMPKAYTELGSGVMKKARNAAGVLLCTASEGGFHIELRGWCPKDGFCDALVLNLHEEKIDFSAANCVTVWSEYTADGVAKWLYDGYYRVIPEAYEPTAANAYYRCAASYVVRLMAEQIGVCSEAPYITLACWDTMMDQQDVLGFWRTLPRSNWLYESYGIDAGFYDTRFNTDLMELGWLINTRLGELPRIESVKRYADYFENFYARYCFMLTPSGGRLTADYMGEGLSSSVHCSLNHLAAECLSAYHLSELLERPSLAALADSMLLAIDDTAEGWVKEDHDLYYSVAPGGEYSGKDYESLTYNDLLSLQRYLCASGREPDPAIDMLLNEKFIWMTEHKVSDYLK